MSDTSETPLPSEMSLDLIKVPSYVHPEMKKMYHEQYINLKKQISLAKTDSNPDQAMFIDTTTKPI